LIYGWQDEIVRATKKIIKAWIEPEKLTKQEFRKYTDTWKFPIVDLIIRTGWDIRHSWFLLYDSEYAEYYFTPKKWPEFDEKEFDKAIDFFNSSKRNFGK
jgi:undecaprenyl diphosphate synthase